MADELNKQKQDADEDKTPKQVQRDGFTAEEIGQQSSYEGTTETAQRMQRGKESGIPANSRDSGGDDVAESKENLRD